ncbi:MAG: redoxin domain-containing protein [Eubacteriales bacterium]|nr:redoxin domain-containing protein [Eubacteriales bacterium]
MHERYGDDIPMIGQTAPSFQVKATNGIIRFPEDYKGKWTIIFSIPRDFHANLIVEPKQFAEMIKEFEKNDTQLIGLFGDSIYRYIHFCNLFKQMREGEIQKIMKNFSIVEDVEKVIAKKFCMIQTKFQFMAPVEPVFIIDPFCRIRCIQNYNDSTWKNMKEINHIVTALRNADAEKQEMLE